MPTATSPKAQLKDSDELLTAPLSEVYAHLTGKDGQRRGQETQFLCVFHPDNEPSLYINDEKGMGHCFGCDFKFNRWTLLKELGVPLAHRHNGQKPYSPRPTPEREIETLKTLGRSGEAEKLKLCHTQAWVKKCGECGETFVQGQHCDHPLCPTCNRRHAARFFHAHWDSLDFHAEMWGITLALPGIPLRESTSLKDVVKRATDTLAELRRKFSTFDLFQNAIVVRQLKVKHGVAWLKLHILMDTVRAEVEIFRRWWAEKYSWSPVRRVQEFNELLEAVAWLQDKAAHPLEEWDTPEDVEAYLEGMKHTPVIYGLGRLRSVRGGRGQSKTDKRARKKAACPFCGSEEVVTVSTVPWEHAWHWDKRYSPPSQGPP